MVLSMVLAITLVAFRGRCHNLHGMVLDNVVHIGFHSSCLTRSKRSDARVVSGAMFAPVFGIARKHADQRPVAPLSVQRCWALEDVGKVFYIQ